MAVLASPADHAGQTYDLTGPAELSLAEAASIVATATGRPVRYHAETVEEATTLGGGVPAGSPQ